MRESTIRFIQYILGIVIVIVILFHLQIFTSLIGLGYDVGLSWEAVVDRMNNVFYDTIYTILLFAVLGHGLLGIRNILYELTMNQFKRRIITLILFIVFILVFIYGMIPIVASGG